jgi:hypothetical protein
MDGVPDVGRAGDGAAHVLGTIESVMPETCPAF